MTPNPESTASRVYALAKEGKTKAEIARLLGKSTGTVRGHLDKLLSVKALRIAQDGAGKPTRYARGTRFAAWEAAENGHAPCHGRGASAGVVVHALAWRQAVHPEARLKAEPVADVDWHEIGNGTRKRSWVEQFETYEVTVQQTAGKRQASLTFKPGKVFVAVPEEKDPDQYRFASEVRARAAWQRCRDVYGFAYLGDLKPSNRVEKAQFAIEGYQYRGPKIEVRRPDGSWAGVDDTPNDGTVETSSPEVIRVFATGPERWAAQEEHNVAVEAAQADLSGWVQDLGKRMAQEGVEFQKQIDTVARALGVGRRDMGRLLEVMRGMVDRGHQQMEMNLLVAEALAQRNGAAPVTVSEEAVGVEAPSNDAGHDWPGVA